MTQYGTTHDSKKHENWEAPQIKETGDITIPISLLRGGFTVVIPPIPGAVEGSTYSIVLSSKYGLIGKPFKIVSPAAALEVRIEGSELEENGGRLKLQGTGYLQYVYNSGPSFPGVSNARDCYWQEAVPTLRVKEYEEASSDSYVLPSESATKGITLELAPWENMAEGDTVNFCATATTEGSGKWLSYSVQREDLSRTLAFPYEPELLKALRPGVIQASYALFKDGKELRSHPITLDLLPLLPDPQPKHQKTDINGNKTFLTVVESDENGFLFAHVIQNFSAESPGVDDELMLVVNSAEPHSYFYPLKIEQPSSAATFKIPQLDLQSLLGRRITLSTLWQRSNGEVISSPIGSWRVAASAPGAKLPSKKTQVGLTQ